MSSTTVYTSSHSVVYVTDQILSLIKDIINLLNLDVTDVISSRESHERAIKTWLQSQDLLSVIIEFFEPVTDKLVTRWQFEIDYGYGGGDGAMWKDPNQVAFAVRKLGTISTKTKYNVILTTKNGRPDVLGWGPTTLRSTDGFVKQNVGTAIGTHEIGASASYWRRT